MGKKLYQVKEEIRVKEEVKFKKEVQGKEETSEYRFFLQSFFLFSKFSQHSFALDTLF